MSAAAQQISEFSDDQPCAAAHLKNENESLTCGTPCLTIAQSMKSSRRTITFRPGDPLLEAMQALTARDGIKPSEMIRRALTAFLKDKGITTKTDRQHAPTRRRP